MASHPRIADLADARQISPASVSRDPHQAGSGPRSAARYEDGLWKSWTLEEYCDVDPVIPSGRLTGKNERHPVIKP